jgi:flagellar hook-associated protein 3 FlgL
MRTTMNSYYNNFQYDQNNVNQSLYETTKRISSGLKIKYGYEDSSIMSNTLRLDTEIQTLTQIKDSSHNAKSFTNNTDSILSDMSKSLEQFKVKLLSSANDTHSKISREALAKELEGIKKHIKQLANTSIDGKYLFSGTALYEIPIDQDDNYQGNGKSINAFFGSNTKQDFNISGQDLFLGEDSEQPRIISTNVKNLNMSDLHPDIMKKGASKTLPEENYIKPEDTIRDLVGDTDNDDKNDRDTFFYISGVKSTGEGFKDKIALSSGANVQSLLDQIGKSFGNSKGFEIVDVSLNDVGQIEIKDRKQGSSQVEFHMFSSKADVINIDDLALNGSDVQAYTKSSQKSEATLSSIRNIPDKYTPSISKMPGGLFDNSGKVVTRSTLAKDVYPPDVTDINVTVNGTTTTVNLTPTTTIKDILEAVSASDPSVTALLEDGQIKTSGNVGDVITFSSVGANAFSNNDGIVNDRKNFDKEGAVLKGNMRQILNIGNSYATSQTKLSEVSSKRSLVGTTLNFNGINQAGDQFTAAIELNAASSFTVNGTSYTLQDIDGNPTPADEVTYQQLFDTMGMVLSNTLPASAPGTKAEYIAALRTSKEDLDINFDHQSRIKIDDRSTNAGLTNIEFTLNDSKSSTFNGETNALSFQSNSAITINDPKIDLFTQLNTFIEAVRDGRTRSDANGGIDPRNLGIQNSIAQIDQLMSHVESQHTVNGSQGQSLQHAIERSEILILNTSIIRSETIDTDLAEDSLKLQQLSLNYQALLSTVSKVSKLSLVNYL